MGVFLRDDPDQAQQRGLLRVKRLVAGDRLEVVGDHRQLHRRADDRQSPSQRHQAVEALRQRLPVRGRQRLQRRHLPEVEHLLGDQLAGQQVVHQRREVLRPLRVHGIARIARPGKFAAGPDGDHGVTRGGEAECEPIPQSQRIREDQHTGPVRQRGRFGQRQGHAAPTRHMEPVSKRAPDLGAGAVRPGGWPINPVALAFERTGRQRDPLAPRPVEVEEACPINLAARRPQLPQGIKQTFTLGPCLLGLRGGSQDDLLGDARLLSGQRTQCPSGSHFQQDQRRLLRQRRHAAGELHRLPCVPGPVVRIGGLRVGDPRAGQVGEVRDARGAQREGAQVRHQRRQDRLHHGRMECAVHVQKPVRHPLCGQVLLESGDVLRRAGDHAHRRPVDRRERDPRRQGQLLGRERHRQHRAFGLRLHQPAAQGHQPQRIRQREHAGHGGRHVLAEAVADHRLRFHAPGQPELRQRVGHDEQGRLRHRGLLEAVLGGLAVDWRGIQPFTQVVASQWLQQFGAAVHLRAEHGLGVVQLPPHVDGLGALAGEHEDHGPRGLRRLSVAHAAPVCSGRQGDSRLGCVTAEQHTAHRMVLPAVGEAAGDVRQHEVRSFGQPRCQRTRMSDQPVLASCGQQQQLLRPPRGGGWRQRRFLQHDMGVRAANAEGADTRPPRRRTARPRRRLAGDEERALLQLQRRIRPFGVQRRRDQPVLQCQRGLDQARHPRGGVGMANVALDRTERADTAPRAAEGLGQRGDLDRVTQRCAGAVGLDIADRVRLDLGNGLRLADHPRLALDARRGEADLGRAIVVDRRTADHRMDHVAVGQRFGQRLEQHHADTTATQRAGGVFREGSAVAVRRQDHALLVQITLVLRQQQRHATGQRQVALARKEALAGLMHRHQRGRAGGLHRHARAAQVQLVRQPHGHRVRAVDQEHLVRAHRAFQRSVRVQVFEQVVVQAAAREYADAAAACQRAVAVAGHVQRLPGGFQQQALLRIEQFGLARREAKEGRVKAVVLGQDGPRPDVVRIVQQRRLDPSRAQFRVGKTRDHLVARAQVAPEVLQ